MYARYQPGTTTLGQRNVLAAAGTASPSQASRGKAVYYKASPRGTPPAAVRYGENAMMAEVKTARTPTTVNGHGVVRRSRNQASPSHHRHRGHGHTTRHRSHHRGSSSGRSHHGGSDHSDSGSGYRTPSKGRRARPTQRLLYKQVHGKPVTANESPSASHSAATPPANVVYSPSVTNTPRAVLPERGWNLEPSEVSVDDTKKLGSGTFSDVLVGSWRGQTVAIKRVKGAAGGTGKGVREFENEVNVLGQLQHPNVVEYIGACRSGANLLIVTELCAGGSLFDFLHGQKTAPSLSIRRRFAMALELAEGMAYLHNATPMVLHRDIKSGNILIGAHGELKIADFGFAKLNPKGPGAKVSNKVLGTPQWMAPEVINREYYDEKVDVYSYAMVLFEIVTGGIPFEGINPKTVIAEVGKRGARPKIPPVDARLVALAELMKQAWSQSPADRPSFNAIVAHINDLVAAAVDAKTAAQAVEAAVVVAAAAAVAPSPAPPVVEENDTVVVVADETAVEDVPTEQVVYVAEASPAPAASLVAPQTVVVAPAQSDAEAVERHFIIAYVGHAEPALSAVAATTGAATPPASECALEQTFEVVVSGGGLEDGASYMVPPSPIGIDNARMEAQQAAGVVGEPVARITRADIRSWTFEQIRGLINSATDLDVITMATAELKERMTNAFGVAHDGLETPGIEANLVGDNNNEDSTQYGASSSYSVSEEGSVSGGEADADDGYQVDPEWATASQTETAAAAAAANDDEPTNENQSPAAPVANATEEDLRVKLQRELEGWSYEQIREVVTNEATDIDTLKVAAAVLSARVAETKSTNPPPR